MVFGLGNARILELLDRLGAELSARGQTANLYIIGGAAMTIAYGRTTATLDIDAHSAQREVLRDIASQIALDEGLPPDWLSFNASAFIPGGESLESTMHRRTGGLTYEVASPRVLLAMKMSAYRAKDLEDIRLLIAYLRITTVREIMQIMDAFFDGESVPRYDRADVLLNAREVIDLIQR